MNIRQGPAITANFFNDCGLRSIDRQNYTLESNRSLRELRMESPLLYLVELEAHVNSLYTAENMNGCCNGCKYL